MSVVNFSTCQASPCLFALARHFDLILSGTTGCEFRVNIHMPVPIFLPSQQSILWLRPNRAIGCVDKKKSHDLAPARQLEQIHASLPLFLVAPPFWLTTESRRTKHWKRHHLSSKISSTHSDYQKCLRSCRVGTLAERLQRLACLTQLG